MWRLLTHEIWYHKWQLLLVILGAVGLYIFVSLQIMEDRHSKSQRLWVTLDANNLRIKMPGYRNIPETPAIYGKTLAGLIMVDYSDFLFINFSGLWLGGAINGNEHVTDVSYTSNFKPDLAAEPGRKVSGDQQYQCNYFTNRFGPDARLDVEQTVFVYEDQKTSVYLRFTIRNSGTKPIENMYTGFWWDPEIGYALDDLVGYDPERNLAFAYNAGMQKSSTNSS